MDFSNHVLQISVTLDPKIPDWPSGRNRNRRSESINLARRILIPLHLPSLKLYNKQDNILDESQRIIRASCRIDQVSLQRHLLAKQTFRRDTYHSA